MKHVPLRTCVVCRNQCEKSALLRIVKGKDGNVFVDASGKADGRGAYVCKDCIKDAVKRRSLNKAFKMQIPQDVYDELLRSAEEQSDAR